MNFGWTLGGAAKAVLRGLGADRGPFIGRVERVGADRKKTLTNYPQKGRTRLTGLLVLVHLSFLLYFAAGPKEVDTARSID